MTTATITRVFQTYLKQPRWVGWHIVDGQKVPLIGTSQRRASVDKPDTWRPFAECPDDRRGIVFNGDGLGGVDLDGCRDPDTGVLADWASELIDDFGSYAEVSPSGTGVKIFAAGAPAKLANHMWPMVGEPIKGKAPQIEAYVGERYFTVTGDKLSQTPGEIRTAPEAWARLRQRRITRRSKRGSNKAEEGRNGALFSLGCQLRQQGKSDDEIEASIRAANVKGNTELHPNFAEGALGEQEIKNIIRSVLKQPKGESEDDLLAQLNAEYCVVQDGGKTRILRFDLQEQIKGTRVVHRRLTPAYFTFGDFHNFHKNRKVWSINNNGELKPTPLGNWWTSHEQRRGYKGLVFRPDVADSEVNGRLNLWRGFGVEPKAGDWSLMQRHIAEVIAAGNEKHDAYITHWLAWGVQHPAEPAEVALVLKGGRGVGKGTLGNAMVHIFGQHATHISSVKHLVGHFNVHLRDACLLFADEAYWPGDKKGEGELKRLITEPTLFIEPKFVDAMTVPNMLHVLMASNEDWIVPAGEFERRYAVFEVSEQKRQDQNWFGPLNEQLERGGYQAMLHDLLHLDLGDWHPRAIPITEALRKQQLRSLAPFDAWVLKFLEDGVLPMAVGVDHSNRAVSRSQADVGSPNPRNGLYDVAREQPTLRYVDEQVLAAHLKQWGCKPWRTKLVRGWEFPPLAECRTRWEQRFPGWAWQHPEVTEWESR